MANLRVFTVVVDCREPEQLARFWATAMSCEVQQRNPGEFQVFDPAGTSFPLYFMGVPEPKVGKNRLHLDLVTDGDLDQTVAALVEDGATLVEMRQDDATYDNPDTFAVMTDPEGNVFCVTTQATLAGWE